MKVDPIAIYPYGKQEIARSRAYFNSLDAKETGTALQSVYSQERRFAASSLFIELMEALEFANHEMNGVLGAINDISKLKPQEKIGDALFEKLDQVVLGDSRDLNPDSGISDDPESVFNDIPVIDKSSETKDDLVSEIEKQRSQQRKDCHIAAVMNFFAGALQRSKAINDHTSIDIEDYQDSNTDWQRASFSSTGLHTHGINGDSFALTKNSRMHAVVSDGVTLCSTDDELNYQESLTKEREELKEELLNLQKKDPLDDDDKSRISEINLRRTELLEKKDRLDNVVSRRFAGNNMSRTLTQVLSDFNFSALIKDFEMPDITFVEADRVTKTVEDIETRPLGFAFDLMKMVYMRDIPVDDNFYQAIYDNADKIPELNHYYPFWEQALTDESLRDVVTSVLPLAITANKVRHEFNKHYAEFYEEDYPGAATLTYSVDLGDRVALVSQGDSHIFAMKDGKIVENAHPEPRKPDWFYSPNALVDLSLSVQVVKKDDIDTIVMMSDGLTPTNDYQRSRVMLEEMFAGSKPEELKDPRKVINAALKYADNVYTAKTNQAYYEGDDQTIVVISKKEKTRIQRAANYLKSKIPLLDRKKVYVI